MAGLMQVQLFCPSSSKARPATLWAAALQDSLLIPCRRAAPELGATCTPGSEVEAMSSRARGAPRSLRRGEGSCWTTGYHDARPALIMMQSAPGSYFKEVWD